MITRTYQFPRITDTMYNKLKTWYETHNDGKCAKGYHGAIGGNLTFKITPTSIGDFIKVKCSCGGSIDLSEV